MNILYKNFLLNMMIRDYTIIEEIGQGAFSTVFKAQHNETKEYYAIKRLKG